MNLSRRGVLAFLAAGLALDPERLLWVPGKKLISIPKPLVDWNLIDSYEAAAMDLFELINALDMTRY